MQLPPHQISTGIHALTCTPMLIDKLGCARRIWNCGDHRRKIITMAPRDEEPIRSLPPFVSQDIPADQPTTTALENALMRQLRGLPSVSSEYT